MLFRSEFTNILDSNGTLPGDLRVKLVQAELCLFKIGKFMRREVAS